MNTISLLTDVLQQGVELRVKGGKLRYRAPQGVLTPSLHQELSERKEEIIALLDEDRKYFLSSFAQQRLWFLDRLVPASPAYNVPAVVRLTGSLDVAALEQSLDEIARRHETLRTTFTAVDGRPVQVIALALALALPVVDLRELAEPEREAEVQRLASEGTQWPFDLDRGPLVRASLLRLAEKEHVLVLTMHHIISDAWSLGLFIRELAALYEAFSRREPSPLDEPPVQYADFTAWQWQWLQGEALEAQLSYWRQQLDGLPVLQLPTDHPRPAVNSFRGTMYPVTFSRGLTEGLKALSQREGVTLFMTLLAAFKTLLHRYTAQQDIVVGSGIANRNRPELEGLIGFFASTLVLRTDLSGNPRFRELLARVREVTLGAYAHQDVPFEKLVMELQPERDMSRSPLFQVAFVLQNFSLPPLELKTLTLSPVEFDPGTSKVDLTLFLWEGTDGLRGSVEYNTDLFEEATIRRMMGHLQTLLEGIVANPDQRLSDLPLLGEEERHQLVVDWNDTVAEYPQGTCSHQLFEAQVERTPDAVAVAFENEHLTYRELNRRANQLAHYLQGLGVGPEVLVGVCAGRSVEMVIGILGILKAGGAYVPLDPAYPKERLAFMLTDARLSVLLTESRLLPTISNLRSPISRVMCLDTDWESVTEESAENPNSGVTAENLAYLIYTSGSTGRPKGVLVGNRGLCNLVEAQRRIFDVHADSRVLQFAALSFDASVSEVFVTLLAGATLCLGAQDSLLPGPALIRLLRDQVVTEVTFPPSVLATLPAEELPGLKTVVSAGEACSAEIVARWAAGRRFLNAYGPTEGTVCATATEGLDDSRKSPPIGKPISNVRVYILDPHLRPVPIGVPGELYISGVCLARGYLHQPGLTAERFLPDPFPPSVPPIGGEEGGGARLYRTGDLARYLPDGSIEFLGRVDHQVKVRGFRIELGEIEAVLGQHPSVREAVVLARDDGPGHPSATRLVSLSDHRAGRQLVAYVVALEGQDLTVSELRRFLREKLPNYMIPSAFVMLDALPLSPNGKVNRKALPTPGAARPEMEQTFVAPRSPVEKTLAGIWADVLGIERVGIHDNFFELGGDSILSIQIIARANQAGIYLAPRQLFENQTIAELAIVADSTPAVQAEQGLVMGTVPLTPIQHWFFEQNLADPHHFNQALLFKVKRPLDPILLEEALWQLLSHHDGLRLRFEQTVSGWRQLLASQDRVVPFTQIDLSVPPETEQRTAIERATAELQASLNLSAGPMVRVALFDLGEQRPGRLFIVIHHLVVDGVSWRVLLEDLETVYWQLSQGEAIKLPPKTTSFKRWAERLTEYAQLEEVQQELNDWLAKPWERASPLPVDHPGGVNTVASAQTVSVSLSAEETQALLREIPRAYRTQINDALLTALAQAFAQWTGDRLLLVDLEGHGREEIFEDVNLSRTVGWFTSVFPVLLDLRGVQEPGEALKSVKEQLRRIPNRGINYGVLRYLSRDEEIIERFQSLPQSQVSFNYLGQLDQTLSESSVFGPAPESGEPRRSSRGVRRHLLEVNGSIGGGQLQLAWTYSENLHRRSTIESLAQGFVEALQMIIVHCQSPGAGGYTPSDFPAAQLSQGELDRLIARVSRISRR